VNQKKAKKLRKLAKKGTVGMPERAYALAGGREMGGVVQRTRPRVINNLKSTRGTYRWLKGRVGTQNSSTK